MNEEMSEDTIGCILETMMKGDLDPKDTVEDLVMKYMDEQELWRIIATNGCDECGCEIGDLFPCGHVPLDYRAVAADKRLYYLASPLNSSPLDDPYNYEKVKKVGQKLYEAGFNIAAPLQLMEPMRTWLDHSPNMDSWNRVKMGILDCCDGMLVYNADEWNFSSDFRRVERALEKDIPVWDIIVEKPGENGVPYKLEPINRDFLDKFTTL